MIEMYENHEKDDELVNQIQEIFDSYNAPFTEPYKRQDYTITLKDGDQVIGGLTAYSGFNWMYVETLAVSEPYRNQGLASRLLKLAEDEAVKRGCAGIWLNTISFQAPDFYRKHSYEEFGRLESCPKGFDRVYFRKYL